MARVQLPPCCRAELVDIRDTLQLGALLQPVMITGQLLVILAGRGKTAQIPTAINTVTTEWTLLAKAVQAAPQVARAAARRDAGLHRMQHPGGPLAKFWKDMYDNLK